MICRCAEVSKALTMPRIWVTDLQSKSGPCSNCMKRVSALSELFLELEGSCVTIELLANVLDKAVTASNHRMFSSIEYLFLQIRR